MKDAERLLGTLIHRHFSTDKVRPDGGDANTEYAFDSDLYLFVHLDQADWRLADVLVQNAATMNMKSAQAYHSGR